MDIKNGISKKLNRLVALLVAISIISVMVIMGVTHRILRETTSESLTDQAIKSTTTYVSSQTKISDAEIENLVNIMESTAERISYAYENPDKIIPEPVREIDDFAGEDVAGKTTFHYTTFDGKSNQKPEILEELKILSSIQSDFKVVRDQSPEIVVVSLYTISGISIGYDENVLDKVGLGGFDPEALEKDYFLVPKVTGETFVSDAYEDSYGRGLMVTIACPVYANGKLMGVVAGDALIGNIYDLVCAGDTPIDGGYKVLLSAKGDLICSNNYDENTTVESVLGANTGEILDAVLGSDSGYIDTSINGSDVYVMFDKMKCGWKLLSILPVSSILEPVSEMNSLIFMFSIISVIVGIVLLAIMIFISYKVCTRLLVPLLSLTNKVEAINGDSLDYVADINTEDEIALLDSRFYEATIRMKEYAENIAKITAEKERIGAELNVATQIQSDMLPKIFPPFPELPFFDLYATMDPAKEVGGDFYDYFRIDDDHIGLTIADVSGKGVPAALFMVISKTLLKDQATSNTSLSPAEILAKVNNLLCEGNESSLFCTCWLGIYNIKTHKMVCASAGHEFPAIRKKDGRWELFKDPHGIVLAAMEDMEYEEYELVIEPGDTLYVYTDGVPEATNANDELYGTDRMIESLNNIESDSPKDILIKVREDIETFVDGAPQFDDITMLGLKIN